MTKQEAYDALTRAEEALQRGDYPVGAVWKAVELAEAARQRFTCAALAEMRHTEGEREGMTLRDAFRDLRNAEKAAVGAHREWQATFRQEEAQAHRQARIRLNRVRNAFTETAIAWCVEAYGENG